MNTELDKQVIVRFFEALDVLKQRKHISSVNQYCSTYNIDKRNLYAQKKNLNTSWFHMDWIIPMVTEYGVSSLWLLTGLGKMFLPMFDNTKTA